MRTETALLSLNIVWALGPLRVTPRVTMTETKTEAVAIDKQTTQRDKEQGSTPRRVHQTSK